MDAKQQQFAEAVGRDVIKVMQVGSHSTRTGAAGTCKRPSGGTASCCNSIFYTRSPFLRRSGQYTGLWVPSKRGSMQAHACAPPPLDPPGPPLSDPLAVPSPPVPPQCEDPTAQALALSLMPLDDIRIAAQASVRLNEQLGLPAEQVGPGHRPAGRPLHAYHCLQLPRGAWMRPAPPSLLAAAAGCTPAGRLMVSWPRSSKQEEQN